MSDETTKSDKTVTKAVPAVKKPAATVAKKTPLMAAEKPKAVRTSTKPKTTQVVQPLPSQAAVKNSAADGQPNQFMGAILKLALVFIVGFSGGWTALQLHDSDKTSLSVEAGERVVLQESELISNIAEEVGKSVVSINVQSVEEGFFGRSFESGGAGTGIIISADGYILTNKHVIPDNTTGISVVLSDGTSYEDIDVVGRDPFTDIAYLKINNVSGLTPAVLGDSSEVRVGEKVVAIGNALGEFSNTVTSGIISGLSRPIVAGDGASSSDSLQNLFQTDASINPGNSGGPLVNASGEVIGVNTAVAGNAENIGFAIPLDDIRGGVESVLTEGELIKPFVGVRYVTITPEISEALGLPVESGAYLDSNVETGRSVVEGSPADKAGLKEGDIIIRADGEDITDETPLGVLIARFQVGDTLSLIVLRDSEEITIDVVLERVPENLSS